jgi:two-component system response regulator ChvI
MDQGLALRAQAAEGKRRDRHFARRARDGFGRGGCAPARTSPIFSQEARGGAMISKPIAAEGKSLRVALVDDDNLFRESLGLNLAEAGYDVVDFDNGEDALSFLLGGDRIDALLLDWRMPGLDGLGVLRRLRAARSDIPVIFLTVLGDQNNEEAALRLGAVDFIDKSRRLPIILQRLALIAEGPKVQMPAARGADPTTEGLRVGKLELRADIRRAFWAERQVDLTLTEYEIVRLLAEEAGHDVTYRQIYDLVRGRDFAVGSGDDGYRANVRAFIKRIRKKFKDVDDDFDMIENYPGYGYRWRGRDSRAQ